MKCNRMQLKKQMPTIEKCVQANYTVAVPIWQSMITNLLLQALASDVIAVIATENNPLTHSFRIGNQR